MPANAVIPLFGAVAVVIWRIRETTRPLTKKAILIPPLAMSTGHMMFLYPPTRIPWWWALLAYVAGATLLAVPLIKTTRFQPRGESIYMTRSKAFLWVIFALFVVRFALRSYVEAHVSLLQTGSIFYLLAFGMIVHWRVNMWNRYSQMRAQCAAGNLRSDSETVREGTPNDA